MTHEEICTYEVCKLAKEKGFDWGCLYHYDRKGSLHQHYAYDAMNSGVGVDDLLMYDGHLYTSECLAPTQSLLQRWLREEKDIQIIIKPKLDKFGAWVWGHYDWVIRIYNEYNPIYYSQYNGDNFDTYEQALEDAELYVLKNLL